jgi:transposase
MLILLKNPGLSNLRSETEVVLYVQKQLEQADEVVVVYEAGPLGYGLYRKLTALGVKCLVCAADRSQRRAPVFALGCLIRR